MLRKQQTFVIQVMKNLDLRVNNRNGRETRADGWMDGCMLPWTLTINKVLIWSRILHGLLQPHRA